MATNIPFEYQTDFGQAAELEKLAQLIAQQRAKSQPQGQMVSGHYVRASPMQHLADLFAAYNQGFASKKSAAMQQAVRARMAGDERGQIEKIAGLMAGQPIQTAEGDFGPGERPTIGSQTYEAPRPIRAEQTAFLSPFERVQKLGETLQKNRQSVYSANVPYSTPESIAMAQGDPSMLQPKQPEMFGPVEAQGPPGQDLFGQVSKQTGKVAWAPKPAQQTVSVGDKAGGQILAQAAKDFREPAFRDRVQKYKMTLDTGTFAWRLLDEGKLNLGVDSDIKTFAQKLGSVLGLPVDPRAPATELYKSFIIPQVGNIIRMFGAGTGLSDADREFAQQAVALATRDPRMIEVALAFALRGASKEIQALEKERAGLVEMGKGMDVHPAAFGQPLDWSFQVPKGASQTFPQNPYEPGALETWGMQRLYGAQPARPEDDPVGKWLPRGR